ncbi:MAG: sigma 54-interacting transcriptional regulator, partial [Desulfobacterales bacterium]|nr:sigma 54-interacting transcriptional regulator [Desulfobacterales bacterium]
MNQTLRRLLASQNMGALLFDTQFTIVKTNPEAVKIIKSLGQPAFETDLLSLFPELVGNESFIADILNQKEDNFRLDFINRLNDKGQSFFLNLLLLPDEEPGHGLLILEDVTTSTQALQAMNQQRYELFLYKRDPQFRKNLLSESILGNTEKIQRVRQTILKLSKVPSATVLLLGETGCGKNLAARVV